MALTPRIVFSELGKRWYVVTRYTIKQGVSVRGKNAGEAACYLMAQRKYDVTDQMTQILKSHRRKQR